MACSFTVPKRPGPVKDTKLTPRITETAKALWYVYLAFTIACMLAYRVAGMGWFDASVSCVLDRRYWRLFNARREPGVVRQHRHRPCRSILHVHVAGINFSLHFFAWRYVSIKHYFQDQEFRAYTVLSCWYLSGVVIGTLFVYRGFADPFDTFIDGLFQAVSIGTTTGFTTENFAMWPAALPALAYLRKLRWRLRRIDRRRYQGYSLAARLQAGRPGNRAPRAPKCRDSRSSSATRPCHRE